MPHSVHLAVFDVLYPKAANTRRATDSSDASDCDEDNFMDNVEFTQEALQHV